jgi:DtxR family transcriptional regulator, Mn-dependent transcriptional regulator
MSTEPRRRFGAELALTPAMEDYVKGIFRLTERQASEGNSDKRVSTQSLAAHLSVAAPSVTSMLKRLADLQLVIYEPYYGVALTELGVLVAAEMIRHHRLLELYLTKALGFCGTEVHAEAERLEHFISEKLEERIDAALGYPTIDPHGSPIPNIHGVFQSSGARCLTQLSLNVVGVIHSCSADFPGQAGAEVEVFGRPARGKVHLRIGQEEHLLDPERCQGVLVEVKSGQI